ncbi:MAG TPA: hypothetical protein VF603_05010 [Allosphingosinicella sp.]|jgi:hypothetical protein
MRTDWHLRSDPFPFVGKSLSPDNDPGQLRYYLDFYDWGEAEMFTGLAEDGTVRVRPLPGVSPITVIISGEAGSGRSSIKNLLVYQLKQGRDPATIVLDVPVPPSPTRQDVATVLSTKLMFAVRDRNRDLKDRVKETFDTWKDMSASDPNAEMLFQLLADDLRDGLPGAEVIVILDASSHNLTRDAARATIAMLRGFATYVIMSLTNVEDARFIKDSGDAGRPALIDAPYVDAPMIKLYVERRLAAERAEGFRPVHAFFPFDPEAIDEMFESTSPEHRNTASISVALSRLASALRRKAASEGGAPPTISRADMQAVLGG